jgi:hypothetical protein
MEHNVMVIQAGTCNVGKQKNENDRWSARSFGPT